MPRFLNSGDNPSDGGVSPRIGNLEPITMRCDYQLPWNRQSNQTACGDVIQSQVGDKNWRIVIEGVLTRPMFEELAAMRGQDTVEVVTEEFGRINVAFDQLNVERVSDEEEIQFEGTVGPLLKFQLQTKEDEQDELFSDLGPD